MLTVGPIAENCFIVNPEGTCKALVVDPGDEIERIMSPITEHGLEVEAILVTHCHFDHVGAVADLAERTGAPVYCPEGEAPILADINSFTMPGFGPYRDYNADHLLKGGELLDLAGVKLEVLSTPGHSPAHVTFLARSHNVAFSGDVVFQGSVGRVDLPGGDWDTLLGSLRLLAGELTPETQIFPGHGPATTMETELAGNPFMVDLEPLPAGTEQRAGGE